MSNEVQRVIEGAYKILSDPKRWTKKAQARDEYGGMRFAADNAAVSFCLVGARERSASELHVGYQIRIDAGVFVSEAMTADHKWVTCFNDDPYTTHADVLAVLREAHKLAENWSEEGESK
jgi:hypothetical protein